MRERISVSVGAVQRTLLLPLWGRAVETRSPHPLLIDKTAEVIVENIDYDFVQQARNLRNTTRNAWIIRAIYMDSVIRDFLLSHPYATVVNLGCGLDTTFERVDNGKIMWYDLDLPDVIELRRKFIPESERRIFIPSSLLEESWLNCLVVRDNIIFMAAGVFYYLDGEDVRKFFRTLAARFPGGEIVFDISSTFGMKLANKVVIRDSGLDEGSFLRWGIDDLDEIRLWHEGLEIVESFPLFKGRKRLLEFPDKIGALFSDLLKVQSLIHIKFGAQE